jgi:hypothetical protein
MEQHMNIEIQAVQRGTMVYKTYIYENEPVDKCLKRHNNKHEFVATYKVMTDDYASSAGNVLAEQQTT